MRVLVVDDHEVVRRGVVGLLRGIAGCTVCGEAVDGCDAIEKARELRPDVVIMDVSMPTLNGLEATRALRGALPSCEVIILSQHDSPEMARQAFKAGARGYVIKSSVSRNLMEALDKVARHESFCDPAISGVDRPLDVQEILQRSTALEQALRESEQIYRSTFELAAVGVAHVNPEGRWIRVNKKLCEIVGYSESELLQTTFQEITHPEDLAADLVETEKVRTGELTTFTMEKRYLRKDKSIVWVNLTVSAARDASGRMKHFISLVEDITERREAQNVRARLAAIVESSDDGIVSKDLNGIITSWNAGASRIFGFTAEEAIGNSITIIIPPEFRDEEAQIIGRLRKGERIEHYETVRTNKFGQRLNVSLTISPLRDSKGRVIGASKIARNITQRKEVEAALRESQTQLALALESSRTAMFDWDVIERKGAWNPQMAAIYGFCPAGKYITAQEWHSLFHPDERLRLQIEADLALKDQDQFQFEYRAIRPDGELRWILSHGRIVRDANGIGIRMIGTHTDITDRKQAEEAERVRELTGKLLHAQDEERRRIARELHDSAGQLIAALQMKLVPMQAEAEELSPEFSNGVRESLNYLQQLSEELRTVSYLLHPPLLDEAGLPSALRWYVQGFSERSKIDVELELPPNLRRLSPEMEVTIFRVIQECLTNIHRHSGSKQATIRVLGSPDEIQLEVQDYGKGMPSSSQNGSQHFRYGVGIQGMSERIRQLNGSFEIQSHAHGTVVIARLPVVNAPIAVV
ncbi:MAG: PAS domain S-box protein [Candidatus Sulfotelmatobacter sp.]